MMCTVWIPTSTLTNTIQPPCQAPSTCKCQIVAHLIHHRIRRMFLTWPPKPSGLYDVPVDSSNTPTRILHQFKHKM